MEACGLIAISDLIMEFTSKRSGIYSNSLEIKIQPNNCNIYGAIFTQYTTSYFIMQLHTICIANITAWNMYIMQIHQLATMTESSLLANVSSLSLVASKHCWILSNFFQNHCNITDCTYKRVGGGWGRVGSWRRITPSNWTVWSSYEFKKC